MDNYNQSYVFRGGGGQHKGDERKDALEEGLLDLDSDLEETFKVFDDEEFQGYEDMEACTSDEDEPGHGEAMAIGGDDVFGTAGGSGRGGMTMRKMSAGSGRGEDSEDACVMLISNGTGGLHRKKKAKKRAALKKAPGAPKRFKSPYICFSIEMRDAIKKQLPADAKVTNIMKKIAETWRALTDEERRHWQNKAQRDRERYDAEMSYYSGPLKVPRTRMKRHPEAPKRVMSAFLHFSKLMKPQIKSECANLSNSDIAKILAERWKSASKEEKMPYLEREREDKITYKKEMARWQAEMARRQKDGREPGMGPNGSMGDPSAGISTTACAEDIKVDQERVIVPSSSNGSLQDVGMQDDASLVMDYMAGAQETFRTYNIYTRSIAEEARAQQEQVARQQRQQQQQQQQMNFQRAKSMELQRIRSLGSNRQESLELQRRATIDIHRMPPMEIKRAASVDLQRQASLDLQRRASEDGSVKSNTGPPVPIKQEEETGSTVIREEVPLRRETSISYWSQVDLSSIAGVPKQKGPASCGSKDGDRPHHSSYPDYACGATPAGRSTVATAMNGGGGGGGITSRLFAPRSMEGPIKPPASYYSRSNSYTGGQQGGAAQQQQQQQRQQQQASASFHRSNSGGAATSEAGRPLSPSIGERPYLGPSALSQLQQQRRHHERHNDSPHHSSRHGGSECGSTCSSSSAQQHQRQPYLGPIICGGGFQGPYALQQPANLSISRDFRPSNSSLSSMLLHPGGPVSSSLEGQRIIQQRSLPIITPPPQQQGVRGWGAAPSNISSNGGEAGGSGGGAATSQQPQQYQRQPPLVACSSSFPQAPGPPLAAHEGQPQPPQQQQQQEQQNGAKKAEGDMRGESISSRIGGVTIEDEVLAPAAAKGGEGREEGKDGKHNNSQSQTEMTKIVEL